MSRIDGVVRAVAGVGDKVRVRVAVTHDDGARELVTIVTTDRATQSEVLAAASALLAARPTREQVRAAEAAELDLEIARLQERKATLVARSEAEPTRVR